MIESLDITYLSYGKIKAKLCELEMTAAVKLMHKAIALLKEGDEIVLTYEGLELARWDYLKTLELK